MESAVRCELEQTPPHTTQMHPELGLQCLSFRQIPPKPRARPSAWTSAESLPLLLSHYLLYIPPLPHKRPVLCVAHVWSPASNALAAFFFFFFCLWLLVGEFSFQEFPTQSVPRKSACSQSPDGKEVPGTVGIGCDLRLLCPDPVPPGPPCCPCGRFSCVTTRKQSLEVSTVFLRAKLQFGKALPLPSAFDHSLAG